MGVAELEREETEPAMKDKLSSVMVLTLLEEWARVPSTLRDSPPWFGMGGREETELAFNNGLSLAMALRPLW